MAEPQRRAPKDLKLNAQGNADKKEYGELQGKLTKLRDLKPPVYEMGKDGKISTNEDGSPKIDTKKTPKEYGCSGFFRDPDLAKEYNKILTGLKELKKETLGTQKYADKLAEIKDQTQKVMGIIDKKESSFNEWNSKGKNSDPKIVPKGDRDIFEKFPNAATSGLAAAKAVKGQLEQLSGQLSKDLEKTNGVADAQKLENVLNVEGMQGALKEQGEAFNKLEISGTIKKVIGESFKALQNDLEEIKKDPTKLTPEKAEELQKKLGELKETLDGVKVKGKDNAAMEQITKGIEEVNKTIGIAKDGIVKERANEKERTGQPKADQPKAEPKAEPKADETQRKPQGNGSREAVTSTKIDAGNMMQTAANALLGPIGGAAFGAALNGYNALSSMGEKLLVARQAMSDDARNMLAAVQEAPRGQAVAPKATEPKSVNTTGPALPPTA